MITTFFLGYAGKYNLAPVYDYLVRRIRSVDKQKFIFFEGVTWSNLATKRSNGIAGPGFDRVPGSRDDPEEHRRSVFSYHYYCPLIQFVNTSKTYSKFTRLMCNQVRSDLFHSLILSFYLVSSIKGRKNS